MALPAEIISLAAQVVDDLRARGETLSTAESLTAGAVSSAIVTIAGASDVFVGSTTAYRDEIKISHLGVDPAIITLSATGSKNFPNSVIVFRLRAKLPSRMSLIPRMKNTHQELYCHVGSSPPFLKSV